MRVIMEYFVRPGHLKAQTFLSNLKKIIWVKPFLGLKRDQLDKELGKLDLLDERLALLLNPIDSNGVKGLIFLDRHIGLLDADMAMDYESIKETNGYEGPSEKWVEREKHPIINDKNLVSLRQTIDWHKSKAELKFDEAKKSHDELRLLINPSIDQNDVELISCQLLYLLKNDTKHQDDFMYFKESVYGAFTAKGPRYLTYPLPPCVKRWVILKGVAETTISKVISEVKEWAESSGLPTQVDRCPLYKGEIDRLLLPSLGVGIIDGNRHHPFEPLTPNDIIMDLDSKFIDQEKIYYYAPEIREREASYKQKMRQGTLEIQEASQDFWAYNQMFEPVDLAKLLSTQHD